MIIGSLQLHQNPHIETTTTTIERHTSARAQLDKFKVEQREEVAQQLQEAGLADQLQVAALDDRYLEVWGQLF